MKYIFIGKNLVGYKLNKNNGRWEPQSFEKVGMRPTRAQLEKAHNS